jgi:hypothetical protein
VFYPLKITDIEKTWWVNYAVLMRNDIADHLMMVFKGKMTFSNKRILYCCFGSEKLDADCLFIYQKDIFP